MIAPIIIGKATLYNLDCMELLKQTADKFYDLAIVDPPYGINAPAMQMGQNLSRKDGSKHKESTAVKARKGRLNSGGGKLKNRLLNQSTIEWDSQIPTQEYFNELFRVSKNQLIWGGNYFGLPPNRGFAIWDKCQPWPNFSACEYAWDSSDKPSKIFRYSNTGGANAETKIHPTQKPIALYEWLLTNYAKTGDKILDTHLGSGSHAIACNNLGFELTACELNQEYFETSLKRIEKQYAQASLFEALPTSPSFVEAQIELSL
jgi:site-specific DNA-methyltransferase (adenine-specific)